ncbi:hypothetical protein H671_2g7300 [Cricetulus griseus]|nr:hypothetical protein H671_2g7300 [Cricetulus griseus]
MVSLVSRFVAPCYIHIVRPLFIENLESDGITPCHLSKLEGKRTYSIISAILQPHPDPPETLKEELGYTLTPEVDSAQSSQSIPGEGDRNST